MRGGTFCRTSPALLLAIPAPELSENARAQKRQRRLAVRPPIRTYARLYRAEMTRQNERPALYQPGNRRSIEAHDGVLASTFTNKRTMHLPLVLDTFDGQRKRNTARMSYPRLHLLSGQSN